VVEVRLMCYQANAFLAHPSGVLRVPWHLIIIATVAKAVSLLPARLKP
jgi:hypothetical protein